jgi:hypothetical protein
MNVQEGRHVLVSSLPHSMLEQEKVIIFASFERIDLPNESEPGKSQYENEVLTTSYFTMTVGTWEMKADRRQACCYDCWRSERANHVKF